MVVRLIPKLLTRPIISVYGRLCFPAVQYPVSRFICDNAILKLDSHEQEQKRFAKRVRDADKFWLRILEMHERGSRVYEEDLKTAWYLATEDYLHTLIELSEIFMKDAKSKFGSFEFSPVMLKTCVLLNKPDAALEIFNNPTLCKSFDNATSILILMDFLIESGHVSEAIRVYEWVEELQWVHVLRNPIVPLLYSIALYKQGTSETLAKASLLSQKLIVFTKYKDRVQDTIAALAIKLKDPDKAIPLVFKRARDSELAWNLKIQANVLKNNLNIVHRDIRPINQLQHRLYEDTVKLLLESGSLTAITDQYKTAKTTVKEEVLAPLKFEDQTDVMPKRKYYT